MTTFITVSLLLQTQLRDGSLRCMAALLARGIFEGAESSQSFSTSKAGRVKDDFETIIESHENASVSSRRTFIVPPGDDHCT